MVSVDDERARIGAVSGDLLHRRGGKKNKKNKRCTDCRRGKRGETDSLEKENGVALNSH